MKKVKIISLLMAVLLLVGIMMGCTTPAQNPESALPSGSDAPGGPSKEADPGNTAKKTIGVIQINFVNPFYISAMEAMQEGADELGYDIIFKSAENSLETEIALVENFIEQGVDAILVDAIDKEGVLDVFKKATDEGIPIMSLFNPIDAGGNYSCAYEHYTGFKGVTTAVAEQLGGKGKICVIQGQIGNYASDERTRGMEDALKNYPGIEVLSMLPCDWDPSKAVEIMQNWLTTYDQIDAVLCMTDGATASLVEIVETADRDILVAGNDGEMDVLQLMTEGKVVADALLGSKRGGWLAMLYADKILKGEEVENTLYIPSYLVASRELLDKMEENKIDLSWIKLATPEEAITANDGYKQEFAEYAAK